ncbi:DUF805 domain-containing protein [Luteolibacter sp. Populi]|uniref:DUF805 domain-containing protein n=1 Tax=Luteolibacter sp. Populi TaxID=3230487 RepID=UPI0034652869
MSADPYQSPAQTASPYPVAVQLSAKDVLTTFNGRIPRRTYWLWTIISVVIFAVIVGIAAALFGPTVDPATGQPSGGMIATLIGVVCYIPLIWVSVALGIKRWHDRGKSGWWFLIGFIPVIGGIWTFVECGCLRGTVGPNQYGPDPT